MAQRDLHNDDIEKLLGEIRKQGEPYHSEEPSPLYWANFRVRVMEQIESKEARKPKAVWSRFADWLAGHVVGASIASSAAAFVVAMLVMWHPFSGQQQVTPPVAMKQPEVVQPPVILAPVEKMEPVSKKTDVAHRADKSYATHEKKTVISTDLATAEVLTSSAADETVSLDELSTHELEHVLQNIESE
jgi:anti-sigma-K factor RskA